MAISRSIFIALYLELHPSPPLQNSNCFIFFLSPFLFLFKDPHGRGTEYFMILCIFGEKSMLFWQKSFSTPSLKICWEALLQIYFGTLLDVVSIISYLQHNTPKSWHRYRLLFGVFISYQCPFLFFIFELSGLYITMPNMQLIDYYFPI